MTVLHYEVDVEIGGKLAQLGARLIDSTAKKLAGEFFSAFGEVVGGTSPATGPGRCRIKGLAEQIARKLIIGLANALEQATSILNCASAGQGAGGARKATVRLSRLMRALRTRALCTRRTRKPSMSARSEIAKGHFLSHQPLTTCRNEVPRAGLSAWTAWWAHQGSNLGPAD